MAAATPLPSLKLVTLEGKVVERCFSLRKPDGSFTLHEHKGLNYSIFQNDSQIAAFTKNRVKIGNGDRYQIRMNDDANLVVFSCLALTVDASENECDNARITYDFGNIGLEDRAFELFRLDSRFCPVVGY